MTDDLEHANAQEVLAFCNKVRQAGGTDALDALLPGVKCDPNSCLIARNLNFTCLVRPGTDDGMYELTYEDTGEYRWHMFVEDADIRTRIAAALNLTIERVWDDRFGETDAILLPRRIGRAARAFDDGKFKPQLAITRDELRDKDSPNP